MKRLYTLTVNGEPLDVAAAPNQTVLEALRYGLGLTGTKQGCDKGDCGACTVLVDGEPRLACCTLVEQVADRAITTIEGVATPEGPSLLQRAFDEAGALQCGFCQPGMILSATALLQRNPDPTLPEIQAALSGNLCRCTGYTKIYEAVQRAAKDPGRRAPRLTGPPTSGFQVIGAPGRKADAIAKATGAAQYTDDLVLPRMAHGRILRSPHAHARILSIDTSEAEALPGVFAVITGQDFAKAYCVIPWTRDEHPLCRDKVRYIGDGVAAVAARDEATARAALERVRVRYEVLPAVHSAQEALAHGAPLVHEADHKGRARPDNLCKEVALDFGDVDAAFASAAALVDDSWTYTGNTHGAIEPHCSLATWGDDGRLTVYSATQVSHYLQRELARMFDLPQGDVRVVQPTLGGAFGGKSEPFDLEFCSALLAKRAGRPVKILYSREEVFYSHRGRHPMDMHFKVAVDAEGHITGVESDILIDGGAYHSFGLVTTYYSGQLLPGPLAFGAYRFRSRRAYTNKPACGPKRGHGSVQPRFPLETALDELAAKIGLDPLELRRRNALPASDATTVNGLSVPSCGILSCLDEVEQASGWRERRDTLPPGRGLGVATSMYISGTAYPIYPNDMPQSGIQLRADRSGRVTVFSGTNDIGQGSDSVFAWIVAEETGVPLDQITVISADTELVPVDLGSYSSRVTFMAGTACQEAAQALRERMVAAVAVKWGCPAEQVRVELGAYVDTLDAERRASTTDAMCWAEAALGTPLTAAGGYRTREVGAAYRGGTIGASPAYSATAHVAEVQVDQDTGVVKVLNVWAAHDCGRAINPTLVQGQIEGSVYMGVSEALFEELRYRDDKGLLHQGPSLLDYRMATSLDTPAIHALIVESVDPGGPYGAKEAGEGPLHPAIPAVANAIFHATGARMRTLPFTPERVLAAIRLARQEGPHA